MPRLSPVYIRMANWTKFVRRTTSVSPSPLYIPVYEKPERHTAVLIYTMDIFPLAAIVSKHSFSKRNLVIQTEIDSNYYCRNLKYLVYKYSSNVYLHYIFIRMYIVCIVFYTRIWNENKRNFPLFAGHLCY